MFCKNCGKEVEDKQKFCQYCGKNLQESFWKAPAVVEEKKEVEVVIHGYTQWFAIRPMVVVEYGSQEIGRVGYNEVKIFNLPSKVNLNDAFERNTYFSMHGKSICNTNAEK